MTSYQEIIKNDIIYSVDNKFSEIDKKNLILIAYNMKLDINVNIVSFNKGQDLVFQISLNDIDDENLDILKKYVSNYSKKPCINKTKNT